MCVHLCLASMMMTERAERLPTVLYRTPSSSASQMNGRQGPPLSAGSYGGATPYSPAGRWHQGYASPSSPILSPMNNNSSRTRTPTESLKATPFMVDHVEGRSSDIGGGGYQSASRQLYGNGSGPPPPIMSLREGSRPMASDRGSAHGKGADNAVGPNPLLANEYAFGSSSQVNGGGSDSNSFRSRWITVYGFQQSDRDLILRELQECGDIISCRNGGTERANFMHIQFQTKGEAQKALSKNGKQISKNLMIGITPISQQHCNLLQAQGGGNGAMNHMNHSGGGVSFNTSKQHALMGNTLDSMPQPVNTFWSKVNEYIFGI